MIDKEMLAKADGDKLVFTSDCPFTSPSAAAAIIAGGPRSGPELWKNEAGVSLKELILAEEAAALGTDT